MGTSAVLPGASTSIKVEANFWRRFSIVEGGQVPSPTCMHNAGSSPLSTSIACSNSLKINELTTCRSSDELSWGCRDGAT